MKSDRVYRVTFARAVAQRICDTLADGYEVHRVRFRLGEEIVPGTKPSGLIAVVSRAKEKTLRLTLMPEVAEILHDGASRYLREAYLLP